MGLPSNLFQSPVILRRFEHEAKFECGRGKAERPLYCIAVPDPETRRGAYPLQNYPEDSIMYADPHPAQCGMAAWLCDWLNRYEHHDGLWVVGWTHPPTMTLTLQNMDEEAWGRLVMIWLDKDGDPQFTVESDHDLVRMIEKGERHYAALACDGWAEWDKAYGKKAQKADFDLKEHEIKREVLESLR